MPRNRVIYQTEALYVGATPATGLQYIQTGTSIVACDPNARQLTRVQSANYGYNLTRRDVNQFGELAAIDRIVLESPTVNLDFGYLNSHFANEYFLGFYINSGTNGDSSCITNILNKTADEKNYFIKTVSEGVDAQTYTPSGALATVIGIGNGFISNFQTEAAVGDFPKTTVTVEALNIGFFQGYSGATNGGAVIGGFSGFVGANPRTGLWIDNPAVNPSDGTKITLKPVLLPVAQSNNTNTTSVGGYLGNTTSGTVGVSALRPGDVVVTFYDQGLASSDISPGSLISDMKIQSYNLNFALSRDPLQKLGSKYAFAREIRFPVQINLSIDANIGDLSTGNLADVITLDESYDIQIGIKHPSSGTSFFNTSSYLMAYTLKGAKLDSENFTSSIGPNKTVTMNFSSQIGGPLQTSRGLFMSGYLGGLSL